MREKFGITGNTLKIIAVMAMAIDHIGAVVVTYFMTVPGEYQELWGKLYWPFRNIGRIAFPIFCFLLVEGFLHTRSQKRYLYRMLLFAVLSELPFNLAFRGSILAPENQNVFWELTLGIVLMMLLHGIEQRRWNGILLKVSLMILVVIFTAAAAEEFHFDYGNHGILTIALLYYFRNYRGLRLMAGALSFLWSFKAMFAFLPIAFYNGKRGGGRKYAFYIFYPAHLLILYLIIQVAACIN